MKRTSVSRAKVAQAEANIARDILAVGGSALILLSLILLLTSP